MTRDEWIDRCAARMTAVAGMARDNALYFAKECAAFEAESNGPSGDGWNAPEDAADEEMSYWDDDGE